VDRNAPVAGSDRRVTDGVTRSAAVPETPLESAAAVYMDWDEVDDEPEDWVSDDAEESVCDEFSDDVPVGSLPATAAADATPPRADGVTARCRDALTSTAAVPDDGPLQPLIVGSDMLGRTPAVDRAVLPLPLPAAPPPKPPTPLKPPTAGRGCSRSDRSWPDVAMEGAAANCDDAVRAAAVGDAHACRIASVVLTPPLASRAAETRGEAVCLASPPSLRSPSPSPSPSPSLRRSSSAIPSSFHPPSTDSYVSRSSPASSSLCRSVASSRSLRDAGDLVRDRRLGDGFIVRTATVLGPDDASTDRDRGDIDRVPPLSFAAADRSSSAS
jgi:hypothetical protein